MSVGTKGKFNMSVKVGGVGVGVGVGDGRLNHNKNSKCLFDSRSTVLCAFIANPETFSKSQGSPKRCALVVLMGV